MDAQSKEKAVALFVHGFNSDERCWGSLLPLLKDDERVNSNYDLATWNYPTKWIELNILGRIPSLQELGHALATEIDSPRYRGRELTLIGHSQGGLVIQSFLADTLRNGRGSILRNVRQAIFIATPTEGSNTGMRLRLLLSSFIRNPQETTLRVLNPDVSYIRSVIRERIVGAVKDSETTYRIPIHALCGLQDDIVVEASARSVFDSVRSVRGDHFSILEPENRGDPRYGELVELLLEPGGHSHRFEVQQYSTHIRVEPRTPAEIHTSQPKPRVVRFDNYATLKRTVTFAPSNRCKHNYVIQYATRGDGYVIGHVSHPNAALPADIGRAEDTGTFFRFEFVPEHGEQYCLNAEVFNGYGEGAGDVHFHLGDHSYYRYMDYILDLSSYISAGYSVSEPQFYFDPKDAGHSELCARRAARQPRAADLERGGVFEWHLENIRHGIVDMVWAVK